MAIFERTYGKVEQRAFQPQKKPARTSLDGEKYSIRTQKQGPEYLLVDGYNVIFAWEELERLARPGCGRRPGGPGGYPLQLSGLPQVRGHPGL